MFTMQYDNFTNNDNRDIQCIFSGQLTTPCSQMRKIGIICDKHLESIFHITLKSEIINSTENNVDELIHCAYVSGNIINYQILPLPYQLSNNQFCLSSQYVTILMNYVNKLTGFSSSDLSKILEILKIFFTDGMSSASDALPNNCQYLLSMNKFFSAFSRNLNNDLTQRFINIRLADQSTVAISLEYCPRALQLLLLLFEFSTVKEIPTDGTILQTNVRSLQTTPNIYLDFSRFGIYLLYDIYKYTENTTISQPLVIDGIFKVSNILDYRPFSGPNVYVETNTISNRFIKFCPT